MKKKGGGTIFIANKIGRQPSTGQKKKIVMYVMYVIPHISNRILVFFWELPLMFLNPNFK